MSLEVKVYPETASYTDEMAQDAVGNILTDSATVDFTYNDVANTITAVVIAGGVDHGSLAGLGDDDHTQYMLNATGAVVDNRLARWDSTSQRLIQNSVVDLSDTGAMSGISTLDASGAVSFSNYALTRIPFFGVGGLITTSGSFIWNNGTSTLIIGDLQLSTDLVAARLNDLMVQSTAKLLLASGTGVESDNFIVLKNQNQLRLAELTANGTDFVAMRAPAALAASYTLTWPADDGLANQALFTDGSGVLSWQTTPTYVSAFTDNRILRADGTTAIQDSTLLITDTGALNPAASSFAYLYVGDGSTPQDIRGKHIGLGDAAPSTVRMINMNELSATVVNAIFTTLEYNGTAGTARAMNMTITHSGSNTSPLAVSSFIATHTVDPSGSLQMFGVLGQANAGVASTQGTKRYSAIRGTVSDGGFTHTAGTIYAAAIHGAAPSAFAGGATVLTWGGLFEDDLQVISDKKLIFEGSSTAKGTTSMSYVSGSSLLRTTVLGTNVWDLTTTINKSLVDLEIADAKNVIIGTSTGTKFGTSTSAKIGFYNKTPVVQPSAYTPTNVTTDRSYDANATTLDEIADVLGTLIADIQSLGLVG